MVHTYANRIPLSGQLHEIHDPVSDDLRIRLLRLF
jgi:hypothetical protein